MIWAVGAPAWAQNDIPNADFETWASGNPVDWATTNSSWPGGVTQSNQAYSGSSAAKCVTVEIIPGVYIGPSMVAAGASFFPVSDKWASLRGYYDLTSVGADEIFIQVQLLKDGGAVGSGVLELTQSTSGYTEFVVPINYLFDSIPNEAWIQIALFPHGDSTSMHSGSEFLLDDLTFSLDSTGGGSCPIAATGDANLVGGVNSTDIIYFVNYVLKAGADPLPCPAGGDVNCSGNVNLTDVTYLVNYVLKAGPPPCDVCTLIPEIWSCP